MINLITEVTHFRENYEFYKHPVSLGLLKLARRGVEIGKVCNSS